MSGGAEYCLRWLFLAEERDKRPNALPFSPLAWEKGPGDEGKTEMHKPLA
jgi:hypothetical protein